MPEAETQPESPPHRGWLRLALVGAGSLIALAIFAIIARETFRRTESDLTTLIDDSAGIAPSSPVLLNGIDVGHVVLVALSGSPDPNKTVRILMRFPRHVLTEIPADSTAAISSSNLLGDKYINISSGTSPRHIEPGAEVPSTPTQDIGTVLSRANVPLNEITAIMDRVDKILDYVNKPQGTLGKLLNNPSFQKHLATVSSDQDRIANQMKNGRGVLARLGELNAEARKPLERLNAIENDFKQGRGSIGKLLNDPYSPTFTAEVQATMREANQLIAEFNAGDRTGKALGDMRRTGEKMDDLMARLESGQGTIGQFTVNPRLRDSLQRMEAELNRLTGDFSKHPTRFVQLRFRLF